ncbi:protein kinase [Kribbella sp. NPDC058245]|uniref:serine/threonine-protein kinase n=1 Tax=Kribbella sp. NPDC058245 TaxID=3346399 RepID=UPI0036E08A73
MVPGDLVADRYRLEAELGRGGMGSVWRAFDLHLGREVALKRSVGESSGHIRREARVGAGLMHPNVVAVFDSVTDNGAQWLVTEYVPARSLDQIIEADGPLPESRVLGIGAQLAAALVAIHKRGIVHRDLKPANVLIADDDVAKLTDLGIARWTEITQSGGAQLTGTLGYVAPEVANGAEATAASDVFALGATLYAAVEGGSPWGNGADGPFAQMRRAAEGEPLPYERARQIAPLLDALMAREAANRPTATEALAMLQGSEDARARVKRKRSPRRTKILYGVGALAVCTALLAWYLPHRSDTEPPAAPQSAPDLTKADPCAAISLDALREFGTPFVDPEVLNFGSCIATTTLKDHGGKIQSVLDLMGPDPSPDRPVTPGQLGAIERPPPGEGGTCRRSITLPDTNRIVITTHNNQDADKAPMCLVSETLLGDTLTMLAKGPLPARSWEFPPQSLEHVDACTLLAGPQISKELGKVPAAEKDFGGWGCSWNGDEDHGISIRFSREWPIVPDPDWGGTVVKIGNRSARLIPEEGNKAACEAMIVHRNYKPRVPIPDVTEPSYDEVVVVRLDDPTSPTAAATCQATRTLAESVVRSLPGPA